MVVLKHTGSVHVYFLRFNKKVLLEIFFFGHNKSKLKARRNREVVFAGLKLREWINLHLAKNKVAASYAIVLLVIVHDWDTTTPYHRLETQCIL